MESRTNISGVIRALSRLPGALDKEMRQAFKEHGLAFQARMIRERFVGFTGIRGREGGRNQNRTGMLRRSFGSEVYGGGDGKPLTLAVFSSGVQYARIQEYGGVVKPKRSKYLTIPLSDNQTPAGVTRYPSARELFQVYGEQIRVAKSPKSGQLFIVSDGKPGSKSKRGKNAETQWLFVLKKSVEIPPRLGFRATWTDSTMVADRAKRLKDALDRAAARAMKGGG